MSEVRNVIILGSGPAGLTAGLYTARAELQPLVIGGLEAGGQLMLTSDVENYPGFPTVLGPQLVTMMTEHATKFGAEIVRKNATNVELSRRPFAVTVGGEEYRAKAMILATGASAKWLGLESETRLRGKGVSSCATCDGFFFKDQELAIVGGGDVAMEDATFLTRFATKVTVIHRRDELRASKPLQRRAFANPKITFRWQSEVIEVLGNERVTGVKVLDKTTGQTSELPVGGLFVAIGHEPNSQLVAGQLELGPKGYVQTHDGTATNVEGVFAAGDVVDYRYRQAVTAAGTGCQAAIDAERWLAEREV